MNRKRKIGEQGFEAQISQITLVSGEVFSGLILSPNP